MLQLKHLSCLHLLEQLLPGARIRIMYWIGDVES